MYSNPDLMHIVAKQHMKELAEEASKYRLAAELRRGRRQRSPAPDRRVESRVANKIDRLVALDRKSGHDRKAVVDTNTHKVREDSKSAHPAAAGRLG